MKSICAIAIAWATVSMASAQTPEKKSSPPTKDQEVQEQLRKLEQDFIDALAKGTKGAVAYFERVLAKEAIITEHNGQAMSKAAFLDMAKAGDRRGPVELEQKDLKIQVYDQTAVATGLKIVKGPLEEGMRFTHVYVQRNGQWQIVAAHYSRVGGR